MSTDFTETRFDGAGRMVKTIAPDLSETLYTPLGSELTITDPANRKTKQKKDAFGRLTAVTEDPGGTLQSTTYYRYSVQDDLLAVCQGGVFSGTTCVGGKERTFRYDSLRRLASATNPESGETLYTYDDAGNLTTKRDGNMISVNTTYDAIQRPLLRTYSDGTTPEVTYTWDQASLNGIGRMNRVANSVSTTDYLEFDAMGRILKSRQTTNATPYNFEYQYNLAGGMSLEKYPSLREVRSCYDEAGRISQVKQKANATAPETVVANLTGYAPHGAVTGMTLGTSLVTETTLHDPKRLQVQQLTASTVAAGNWQMNLYYCPGESLLCTTNNGNIVRQKGYGGAAWDYTYDSLNRLELTTENVNGTYKWHQRMKYDPFGNRWILNEAGTLIPNLEATPRAQLPSDPSPFTTKNQWNGASYDPGGNQTTTWGDGTAVGAAKYFYDAENRIKKAEVNWPVGGAGVVEHGYDGDGRRIWKKVGGVVKTTFVYNAAGQLVAEYGESAAMPCTTCYLTADHLGSTRVVWGSDGAMKQLLDYAPFGEEVGANYRSGDVRYPGGLYPRPGGMGVSMEFTGKERDAETGLDYFGARYMSSAQGRFASADAPFADQHTSDPQSWNLYAYARNNPLLFVDPTGERIEIHGSTEEERKKALAALTGNLSKEAQSRVSIGSEKDKAGNTHYFAQISGNIGDFMRLGGTDSLENKFGNLVNDAKTTEFALTDGDLSSFGGGVTAFPADSLQGNWSSSNNTRILVNPNQLSIADDLFRKTVFGAMQFEGSNKGWAIRPMTLGIATWHEFGHAWGSMNGRTGSRSNFEALGWENAARERTYGPLGPKNARRRNHP